MVDLQHVLDDLRYLAAWVIRCLAFHPGQSLVIHQAHVEAGFIGHPLCDDGRLRCSLGHRLFALLACHFAPGTGVALNLCEYFFLLGSQVADDINHLLIGAVLGSLSTTIEQLSTLCFGQVRVCQCLAVDFTRLHFRHVAGKHHIQILTNHAAQLWHVDEAGQASDRLILTCCGQLHVLDLLGKRAKPAVPSVYTCFLHFIFHHIPHLMEDFGHGVGDGRTCEGVHIAAEVVGAHVAGDELQRNGAV